MIKSIFVILTNPTNPEIMRSTKYKDTRIKTYEKIGHARGALTQMKNMRSDATDAFIVELPFQLKVD